MKCTGPRPESEERLKPFVEAATAAIREMDLAEVERQYRLAIDAAEHLDPPDPLALANTLDGLAALGNLNLRLGSVSRSGATQGIVTPSEADSLRQRARDLIESAAGADSFPMADHLTTEATSLVIGNRYEDAEERLHRALTLVERNPELNGRRLMAIRSQLAFIQLQTGRVTEAEETLRRAVETGRTIAKQPGDAIVPPSVGQTGPAALAGAHSMLALLYNQEGRYRDAETAARTAVDLCEQLAEPPAQLGTSFNVLAMSLRHQWKIREAWSFYRRYMALENSRWTGWGWGTRLTMVFANLVLFIVAPRIKPSSLRRN